MKPKRYVREQKRYSQDELIKILGLPEDKTVSILKTLKEVDAELAIVQDSRMKLVEKYCQRDEDGQWKVDEIGNVLIVPEQITIFTTEQNELFNTTLELNCDKLDIDIFDSLMFTPKMLMDIEDFIEIE